MMDDVRIRGNSLLTIPDLDRAKVAGQKDKTQFGDILSSKIKEINKLQCEADRAIANVTLDDSGSVHEAIIALEKADISFRTMMQVRNKIIDAYQEVMRMQI